MKNRRKVTRRRPWMALDSPEGQFALRRLIGELTRDPYRRSHRAVAVVVVEGALAALGL